MNKVITINLNGNAYSVEEDGYALLKKYLDHATRQLAANPDKDEIIADLEQAIADKCAQKLSVRKTVVAGHEIEAIIAQMGPVNGEDNSEKTHRHTAGGDPAKRLYTIREGSIIGGVCAGLAAYFGSDVTVVRVIFVLLTFVSGGSIIALYLLLMFLLPEARTPEEKAEAHGEHFSAQALIDRAKEKYSRLGDEGHWHEVADRFSRDGSAKRLGDVVRVCAGLASGLFFSCVAAGIGLAWTSALISLLASGSVAGYSLGGAPLWLQITFMASAFYVVFLPVTYIASECWRLMQGSPVPKSATTRAVSFGLWAFGVVVLCVTSIMLAPQLQAIFS